MIESPFKAVYYCLISFVIFVFLGVLEHYIPIFQYAHNGLILLIDVIKSLLGVSVVESTTDWIISQIPHLGTKLIGGVI